MTPEEAKEKFGDEEDGYVNCKDCLISKMCTLENNGSGYIDCWEEIAKSTGWSDAVNHPKHYQGKYECIDEMIALFGVQAVKNFCRCNVYKYRFRADRKNGEEDIKKAEWYMEKLMELEKG